jgi:hypothetical protein
MYVGIYVHKRSVITDPRTYVGKTNVFMRMLPPYAPAGFELTTLMPPNGDNTTKPRSQGGSFLKRARQ